jgi:hypothetical protein
MSYKYRLFSAYVLRPMNLLTFGLQSPSLELFNNRWSLDVPPASTVSKASFYSYEFRMILRINRDYFLNQRSPVDFCNAEELCFLCGTDWILKYYIDELQVQFIFKWFIIRSNLF